MIPTYRPSLGAEELRAVASVFESRWLGMGPVTEEFEQRLRKFIGCRHVIAVGHGTVALHLALDALGLGVGDEVIVPSLTFVGTVQAIRMCGAVPVFCEVDPVTLNIDVSDTAARVTPRTRAFLPVHFAGRPCDLGALRAVARQKGFHVVEDAAHALGSHHEGRLVGAEGDLVCFSFDAIKTVTCGEGGAVATGNDTWATRIRQRRRLGMEPEFVPRVEAEAGWQYQVVSHGFRYHLPDLNAAIGLAQLNKLPSFQARRREIVARYDAAFADVDAIETPRYFLETISPWAYVIKVVDGRRDAFRETLRQRGIQTLVQFIPNHLQPAFAAYRTPLPVTERLFEQMVSLPLHLELTNADVDAVIRAVRAFAGKTRRSAPRAVPISAA
jgi:perosamine synthetase